MSQPPQSNPALRSHVRLNTLVYQSDPARSPFPPSLDADLCSQSDPMRCPTRVCRLKLGFDPAHAGPMIQVVMDVTGVATTCLICQVIL